MSANNKSKPHNKKRENDRTKIMWTIAAIASSIALVCCLISTILGKADWVYNVTIPIIFVISIVSLKKYQN